MGAVNTCKATGFSLMVQKWNMQFSNALSCEANAQGLFNALWVPIFSRQKCTHLFAANIYQSFRGKNVHMTKDPELRGPESEIRCVWKFGPIIFRLYGSASFSETNNFRKNGLPTNKDQFSGTLEVQIYESRDIYLFENHGNLSEMGPYGSV